MPSFVRFRGMSELRLYLRDLPEELTKEIKRELDNVGNVVQKDTARLTKRSEIKYTKGAHLADLIGKKKGRDGFSVTIGWSKKVIGKRLWRKGGWRAIFHLYGTRGGVIKSGRRKGTVIPPQIGNNSLAKAVQMNMQRYLNNVGRAVDRALEKAK